MPSLAELLAIVDCCFAHPRHISMENYQHRPLSAGVAKVQRNSATRTDKGTRPRTVPLSREHADPPPPPLDAAHLQEKRYACYCIASATPACSKTYSSGNDVFRIQGKREESLPSERASFSYPSSRTKGHACFLLEGRSAEISRYSACRKEAENLLFPIFLGFKGLACWSL